MKCNINFPIDIGGFRDKGWYYAGPCPIAGGVDRLRIYPHGRPNRRKGADEPYIWCQKCGFFKKIVSGDIIGLPSTHHSLRVSMDKMRDPLDEAPVLAWHSAVKRNFFHHRGISDEWIGRLKLGYAEKWIGGPYDGKPLGRYVIPAYEDGKLMAISLRIDPAREKRLISEGKKRGRDYAPYISYPGSHIALFNANVLDILNAPYVLIDESPLDAAGLTSAGYPAMAVIGLNNSGKAWDRRWNKYLKGKEVFVIAQYDEKENGAWKSLEIAELRAKDIPGARVIAVPPLERYKKHDTGDMIREGRLKEWLMLPKGEKNVAA